MNEFKEEVICENDEAHEHTIKIRDEHFLKELVTLINKHSRENESNTPDFILAQYLAACLAAYNTAVQQRETWYGRDARPCHIEERLGLADRT